MRKTLLATTLAATATLVATAALPSLAAASHATPGHVAATHAAATHAASSQAERDADAIVATGAVGVQARIHHERGRDQVVTSGVAELGTNRPVPRNGYFYAASNTKAFTATAILQLVGEGRLSLEDTVEQWLPGVVQGNENDGRQITIRHLLQHQSGLHDDLPDYTSPADYYARRYDMYTTDELIAAAMRHKPDFKPDTNSWGYSNTGYLLLGEIIERVTGRPAKAEINRRIIRPLGLTHTYFAAQTEPRRPHARGYQWFPGNQLIDMTVNAEPAWAGVAYGLVSTTADLDRFYRALLGGRLLRPAELREMKDTVPATELHPIWPDAEDGLGLFSRPMTCGGRYWGHSGDVDGYMNRTGFTEDGSRGVVVSVSTNREDSFDAAIAQDRAASQLIDNALCNRR
jgi:D-alanyl-D-alanine carboxypeptidase